MSEKLKDFVIITIEKIKYGIFFRLPIQQVTYNWDTYGEEGGDPIIPRFPHILLNLFSIKRARKHSLNMDACGFRFFEFASPIYFTRKYKSLICLSTNSILSIFSSGYEGYKNTVGGSCESEKTVIKYLENKKVRTIKLRNTKSYNYTYEQVIKELLYST
jgi:hypothetical protein